MLRRLLAQLLINALGLWFAALVVDGVHFNGDLVALAGTAFVFSLVSLLIKPFVVLLTLPLTIVTFGLFLPVINALMLMLTSALSSFYSVDGFWAALLGGIFISLVSLAVNVMTGGITIRAFRRSGQSLSGGRLSDR